MDIGEYDGDMCVIIRESIETFGVDRSQQVEKALDVTLNPLGFERVGTTKTGNQIYIYLKDSGKTNNTQKGK